MLTQDDARQIATKLNADIQPGRQHDLAVFRYNGKSIARFGIRRASKEVSHDYIPNQLFITAKQCRELRDCPLTLENYVKLLQGKGKIEKSESKES